HWNHETVGENSAVVDFAGKDPEKCELSSLRHTDFARASEDNVDPQLGIGDDGTQRVDETQSPCKNLADGKDLLRGLLAVKVIAENQGVKVISVNNERIGDDMAPVKVISVNNERIGDDMAPVKVISVNNERIGDDMAPVKVISVNNERIGDDMAPVK